MEQMTDRQIKDWARGLIIEGKRQDVQISIYTMSDDPDEKIRVRSLQEILNHQKQVMAGEDQLAKLVMYYIDAGLQKELREILADDEARYRAYRTVAERELYKKLSHTKDYDEIQKSLEDPEYELELIKQDPELAAWIPDWILAHLRKYDQNYDSSDDNEDDLEEENTIEHQEE